MNLQTVTRKRAKIKMVTAEIISESIGACLSMIELLTLYKMLPQYQEILCTEFKKRKHELVTFHTSSNGITTIHD